MAYIPTALEITIAVALSALAILIAHCIVKGRRKK